MVNITKYGEKSTNTNTTPTQKPPNNKERICVQEGSGKRVICKKVFRIWEREAQGWDERCWPPRRLVLRIDPRTISQPRASAGQKRAQNRRPELPITCRGSLMLIRLLFCFMTEFNMFDCGDKKRLDLFGTRYRWLRGRGLDNDPMLI